MVKPKRSFHAVVSELIEGLRTGAIKLRDEPEGANAVPGMPVSGSVDGDRNTASSRPPTGEEITARGTGATARQLESPRQQE